MGTDLGKKKAKVCLDINRPSHGRTWELLRCRSKLEKSSDWVEDVRVDRPIGPASERSMFRPRV